VQENTQTKYNLKSKQHKIQQNKTTLKGSVTSYDTRPGNETGLFYNAPSPHRALAP